MTKTTTAVATIVSLLFTIAVIADRVGQAQVSVSPGKAYFEVLLKEHQIPVNSKINAFELEVRGGSFDIISAIPDGWKVTIENDVTESKATLRASAMPGAALLNENTFQNIDLWVKTDSGSVNELQIGGRFFATTADGAPLKPFPVSEYSFNMLRLYARHKLVVK